MTASNSKASGVGRVVDPTKNVLDLVAAAIQRQDDLRDAETRRINELAAQRVYYDGLLESMRTTNTNATATLLATSLREVKNDLSERTSKLEQFRWESGGKTAGIGISTGVLVQIITSVAGIAAIIGVVLATRP